jgi:hypothetical protein
LFPARAAERAKAYVHDYRHCFALGLLSAHTKAYLRDHRRAKKPRPAELQKKPQ